MTERNIDFEAKETLKNMPHVTASVLTRRGYLAEYKRLVRKSLLLAGDDYGAEKLWEVICDTTSKNTYFRRVAAAQFCIQSLIEKMLASSNYKELLRLIELARILARERGKCPIKNPKPRHSKRSDTRNLPMNWREMMVAEMRDTPHYLPLLVMACTGCRPSELSPDKGVRIEIRSNSITFHIQGAKVKEKQGQPHRQISYAIGKETNLLTLELHRAIEIRSIIGPDGLETMVHYVGKISGFTSAIRYAGKKLWPRKRKEITPYCFRHAAASDYKESLMPDDVSKAMGHCAGKTKSRYGQRQMSGKKNGLNPSEVIADRPVKSIYKKFGLATRSRPTRLR